MPVSRQNDIGLAGRKPGAGFQGTIDGSQGRQRDAGTTSDPYLRQYVVSLPVVASAAEQTLAFQMPANALGVTGFLRVVTAEVTGGTPTLDIGDSVGGSTSIAAALAAGAVGVVPLTTPGVVLSGADLTYTLGSADWVEFVGELVLTVIASDD